MINLEVGKKHPNYQNYLGLEGAIFDAFYTPLTLTITLPNLMKSEILAIKKSRVRLSVKNFNLVMMLYVQFDDISLNAPFNINLSPETINFSDYEIIKDNQGYSLTILLIDSVCGTLKALRNLTLDNHVSKQILSIAKNQYENKQTFNKRDYDREVQTLLT